MKTLLNPLGIGLTLAMLAGFTGAAIVKSDVPPLATLADAVLYEPDSALYDGFQNRVIACVLAYNHRMNTATVGKQALSPFKIQKWNIDDILWFYVPGDTFLDDAGDLVEAVTYFDQYYDKPLVIYVSGHYIKTYEVVGHELLHVVTEYIEHKSNVFKHCGLG